MPPPRHTLCPELDVLSAGYTHLFIIHLQCGCTGSVNTWLRSRDFSTHFSPGAAATPTWSEAVAPLLADGPSPSRSDGFSCLRQKRPVPLRLGAASADAAGKLLLLLYVDLNCCPEALQLVSRDGSFAKRPPRPRLGVCSGAPGAGWRAARAPWQPALVGTVPWRRRGGQKATRG